jgi:hypothetical protein
VVIGAYHQCVADTVEQFDGFRRPVHGRWRLVYFGFPRSHEDNAERAVRAALALVSSVGALTALDKPWACVSVSRPGWLWSASGQRRRSPRADGHGGDPESRRAPPGVGRAQFDFDHRQHAATGRRSTHLPRPWQRFHQGLRRSCAHLAGHGQHACGRQFRVASPRHDGAQRNAPRPLPRHSSDARRNWACCRTAGRRSPRERVTWCC